MVKNVDHIELIVRDLDEFVVFFQKLGFKLLTRTAHHGGSAELQLPGPNQVISNTRFDSPCSIYLIVR